MICSVASKERKYNVPWERHALLGGSCGRCAQRFGILQMRRNCRRCGRIVCTPCQSSQLAKVEGSANMKPVCVDCFSSPCSSTTAGSYQTNLDAEGGACSSTASPTSQESQPPVCIACGELCTVGTFRCLGAGGAVHESCFVCSVDRAPLEEGQFVLYEGKFYCVEHYKREYCRICKGCSTFITEGLAVDADDCSWHRECFKCAMCQQPLTQEEEGAKVKFFQHNNEIYCERDYLQHFAHRCPGCNFPLRKKNKIKAMGKAYHEECFVCSVCKEPFAFHSDRKFRLIDGQPRCRGNCRPETSSFSASFCIKGSAEETLSRTSGQETSLSNLFPSNLGSFGGVNMKDVGRTTSLASVLPGHSPRAPTTRARGVHLSRAIEQLIQPTLSEVPAGLNDMAFKTTHQVQVQMSMYPDHEISSSSEFEFEAFAPEVFRDLRSKAFGVTEDEFHRSVCSRPLSGGQRGEGKSGQLFFKSWDDKFLVKTADLLEVQFFHTCLKSYHAYLTEEQHSGRTSSLLPQFLGLYSLKFPREAVLHFVVMTNVFPRGVLLQEKYDLKGVLSSKRFVSEEHRAKGVEVLKDRNFVETRRHVRIGSDLAERVYDQLTRDVAFLQKHGRTDYSLLIGVALAGHVREAPAEDKRDQWPTVAGHGVSSVDGREVFFMGIIDILQQYTMLKALEGTMKTLVHVSVHLTKESRFADRGTAVSAVSAEDYGKRFLTFFKDVLS